jgi:hypothetical protein
LPAQTSRKLPARYGAIVVPLILSILMTFIVSGISTVKSLGLSAGVLPAWLAAWGLSWVVAFPTLIVVLPFVRRLAAVVVEAPKS